VRTVEPRTLLTTVEGWYSGSFPAVNALAAAVALDPPACDPEAAVGVSAAPEWLAVGVAVTVFVAGAVDPPLCPPQAANPIERHAAATAMDIRALVPGLPPILIT
jgi:hypothetical protein